MGEKEKKIPEEIKKVTMDVILCGEVVLFIWIRQLCWTATSGTPNQLRSVGGEQPREGGEER